MSEKVVRFNVAQRLEHFAIMSLFTILTVTGFPQKFWSAGWAQSFASAVGGVEMLRLNHRVSGILFSILCVYHLVYVSLFSLTGRFKLTMVPTRQDFADAIKTLRYYLGLEPHGAKFDRYDYRQKFEYWGMVAGGLLMVFTGLLLYYPVFFTAFLPGQLLPAAKVAHSNEGLMAFLVVITWHIYNAHLSPDVFPFDTAIFSGKISRERMHHEHPLELERMEAGNDPAGRKA
jgi:cytochrome b subunit of formate dehydrogenase